MEIEDSVPSSAVVDTNINMIRSEEAQSTILVHAANFMTSNTFSIRAFVSKERKKDVRKTWPFSAVLLERYMREGKSLPHLDFVSHSSPLETSSGGEVSSEPAATNLPEDVKIIQLVPEQNIELQLELEQDGDDDEEQQPRIDDDEVIKQQQVENLPEKCSRDKDEQALEALQQLKLQSSQGLATVAGFPADFSTYSPKIIPGGTGAGSSRVISELEGGTWKKNETLPLGMNLVTSSPTNMNHNKSISSVFPHKVIPSGISNKVLSSEDAAAVQVLDHLLQVHNNHQAGDNDVVDVVVNEGRRTTSENDQQQQNSNNVCPVCAAFTSHSVTALNAHMDGCLSSKTSEIRNNNSNNNNKQQGIFLRGGTAAGSNKSGPSGKVQKMRSITDIIAADPLPVSPRQSDCVKQVRERRAPNNVVLVAEKSSAAGVGVTSGSEQRNLRSRSRGSGSLVSPRLESDRSTRRRRREMSNHQNTKSGDYWPAGDNNNNNNNNNSNRKKRPCNSVEVTSCSWSSISSGTHSKTQEIQVEKLSAAEGDKPSESHGSANCFEPPRDVVDKEKESHERSSSSGTKNAQDDQQQPPVDGHNKMETDEPRVVSVEADVPDTAPATENDREMLDSEEPSPIKVPEESPSKAKEIAEEPPPPSESPREVPQPSERGPENIITVEPAAIKMVHNPPTFVQRRKPVIPNFNTVISSLRSSNVDSSAGYPQANTLTWKGAVALATLGAPLKDGGGSSIPVNKSDVTLVKTSVSDSSMADKASDLSKASASSVRMTHHYISQVATGSRICSPMDDRPRFPAVQTISGVSQATAKAHWLIHSGDKPVIDVDQDSPTQAASPDGTVLRLLGQNVMVESSTTRLVTPPSHKDVVVVNSNKGGPYGQVATCCCIARSGEHVTCSSTGAKNLPPSGKTSTSQVPTTTWRLVQNGIINPVGGGHVNFQTAAGIPEMRKQHQVSCCSSNPPLAAYSAAAGEQETSRQIKLPGDLPHWLLPIKKQKEAESNVIVIDDDDTEEDKDKVLLHGSSRNADVQYTGERLVTAAAVASSQQMQQFHYASSSSTRKREAGEWTHGVEKAAKVTSLDSPNAASSRMVLVPTWTMMIPNNSPAAKRGATAQTYKARIAMMKSCYVNEAGQVVSMVSPASATHHPALQQNCIYQVQGNVAGRHLATGHIPQVPPQVPMNVIELDNGELILVNADHAAMIPEQSQVITTRRMDSQQVHLQQHHVQQQQQQIVDPVAYAHHYYPSHHGAGRTTSFRDGLGRNFVICNSSSEAGRAATSGEQFLVTPILSDNSLHLHHHHQQQHHQQQVILPAAANPAFKGSSSSQQRPTAISTYQKS